MARTGRIALYDVMKGVCIVLMVAGHAKAPGTRFFYLFHMAAFFMLAGLFRQTPPSDGILGCWDCLRRQMKALWFPYAVGMAAFTLLHNLFVRLCFYSDHPVFMATVPKATAIGPIGPLEMLRWTLDAFIFRGHEQIGGAFWFLAALFQISVLYGLVGICLRRMNLDRREWLLQTLFSAVLLAVGFFASSRRIHFLGLEIACSCYCLYHLGALAAPCRDRLAAVKPAMSLALVALALPLLALHLRGGTVSLATNRYPNPAFLLSASFLGWLLAFGISGLFLRVPGLRGFVQWIGRHTLAILILHFLAFKAVSAFGVVVQGLPSCLIAAFPVLFRDGWWWLAYTVAGVVLPLAGVSAANAIRQLVREKT